LKCIRRKKKLDALRKDCDVFNETARKAIREGKSLFWCDQAAGGQPSFDGTLRDIWWNLLALVGKFGDVGTMKVGEDGHSV
jgi:hypothetical protein